MEIDKFLDNIEEQIQKMRDKIISDNQSRFEELVLKQLKVGDVLYVANGTSLLKRNDEDSTTSQTLEKICNKINRGVWDIGFDFEYKTDIN